MKRQVRHWRIDPWVDAFELVSGPEAGFLHCHPTFNIGAMIAGYSRVEANAVRHEQLPGAVVTLNAYQPHSSEWTADSNTYFVLHISNEFWESDIFAGHQPDRFHSFISPINRDPLLFHFMLGLREQLHSDPSAIGIDDIRALLNLSLSRGHIIARSENLTAENAINFNHLLEAGAEEAGEISAQRIELLANDAGMSRYQFARLCQRTAGMQPRRLRIQLMVARAQKIIREGQDLASASAIAGFSDQSHMNREFRRTIGMTPREYQKTAQ